MSKQAKMIKLLRDRLPEEYWGSMFDMLKEVAQGNEPELLKKFKTVPVDIETFIKSPQYLGKKDEVYPVVLQNLIELNSGAYVEAVLTGGIGSGKTTMALYTTAYQLYLLSCMKNPHKQFGLDPSSEIIFIFQSISAKLAKIVSYDRFRAMLEQSPYFQRHFPYNKDLESKMVFPNRIEVVPVSGSDTAAIGQNVMGGVIDELNYMAVVEKSKMSSDGGGYDQAVAVYNSIARRRKSRFETTGQLPGILCLVSSRKYPGEFTDRKEQEALNDPTIFVYDKCVWEIKPQGTYSGEMWPMFIGDQTRQPRMLTSVEELVPADRHLVKMIPETYREDFQRDPINSLREIAGVATQALHPFIMDTERVAEAFRESQKAILDKEWVDFTTVNLKILKGRIKNPEEPRFAHVDLGITSDSAGVACGYIKEFKEIKHGDHTEILPVVVYDFVLEVRPPKGGEIKFFKIRDLFYRLREIGVPVKWVTYDSFQSVDSLQILRQKGFITGIQSMDVTPLPYEMTKTALYDGRVVAPKHDLVFKEISTLERDPLTAKIDHPPHSSKDCSDAFAGVLYGLSTRRELWVRHKVPPASIPITVMQAKTHKSE